MADKTYLSANEVTRDSFLLAHQVFLSGYRPDVIIALWRGGTPIGVAVQEYLAMRGVKAYHTAVKVTSYTGIGTRTEPHIENLEDVRALIRPGGSVLVVDDIFDSGNTARTVRDSLRPVTHDIRFAMPYFKPGNNTTDFEPDYFVHKTDRWLVFPHELDGLTPDEIREKDPFVHDLLFGNPPK